LWNVGKVASLAVIGVELGWVGSFTQFTASGTARHSATLCRVALCRAVPCRAGCSERTYPTQLNAYDSETGNFAYVPQAV